MSKDKKLALVIADDYRSVRAGIREIVTESGIAEVVDEAGSAMELLDKISGNKIDVILLDIAMPGNDGLAVIEKIRAANPQAAVLVVSTYPDAMYAGKAAEDGAAGYLTKSDVPARLVEAIKTVAGGGTYFPSLNIPL